MGFRLFFQRYKFLCIRLHHSTVTWYVPSQHRHVICSITALSRDMVDHSTVTWYVPSQRRHVICSIHIQFYYPPSKEQDAFSLNQLQSWTKIPLRDLYWIAEKPPVYKKRFCVSRKLEQGGKMDVTWISTNAYVNTWQSLDWILGKKTTIVVSSGYLFPPRSLAISE
jgi:hypothetical protein